MSFSALKHKVCLFCRECLLSEQRHGELSHLGFVSVVAKDAHSLPAESLTVLFGTRKSAKQTRLGWQAGWGTHGGTTEADPWC